MRQLEVLRFIAAGVQTGTSPTIREICERFGIASTNGVSDIIRALVRKGCIERAEKGRNGGVLVTDLGRSFLHVRKCRSCGSVVAA